MAAEFSIEHGERDIPLAKQIDEALVRRRAQRLFFARLRSIEHSTVFHNDSIEEFEPRKNFGRCRPVTKTILRPELRGRSTAEAVLSSTTPAWARVTS